MNLPRPVSFPRPHRIFPGLALGLLLSSSLPCQLPAEDLEPATPTESDAIGPIQMQDVSLDALLELLERWTDKTVLKPHNLPAATASLNLKAEVTKEEAIQAVETLLSLNGIAFTPLGKQFLKATPLGSARSEAPEMITGDVLDLPPSGRVAAKLFQLHYLRLSEFAPQINGLLSQGTGGQPVLFEKSNSVLIIDTVSNLQRVESLLQQLDRPVEAHLHPRFYEIQHAKASDLVGKIKGMLSGPLLNQFGATTSYSADDRTNLIVLFSDPRHHAVFDNLIAKLDISSSQDTSNEVIPLKHAAAKEVAAVLSQMITSQSTVAKNMGQDSMRAYLPAPTATPDAPAPAGPDALTQQQFSPFLTILAEERSNAIIAAGTENDLRLIKEMIARIDVLLAQVRIEVVIVEVTLSNNATTGISELGLRVEGDRLTGFSGSLPGLSVRNGTITRPSENVTVSGPWDLAGQITIATTPRKSNANILSVPNIITTHNREGKIFVGEERPVISSYLNDGGMSVGGNGGASSVGAGYRSTVNSKDIGIQLSVKPLIGANGSVQLEIKQEVNDILGEITIDGNPQPRIGRRSTESFVSALSGEIIVLGGLQRSSDSLSTSRLGPVPIIGDLFGSRSRERTRTDLIFFLRPTVLTNTTRDLDPALNQVNALPKAPRKEVMKALQTRQKPDS